MPCSVCGYLSPPGSSCPKCGAPAVALNDAVTGFGLTSGIKTLDVPTVARTAGAETMLPGRHASGGTRDGAFAQTMLPSGAAGPVPTGGPAGPLAVGQAFGARYHIIRMLGIGGMGAVYQAWDSELGVAVAIKVVRPEISEDPTAAAEVERRFKRELLLARQVTHPNVVRIHDLGEIDGVKYITMSYV